MRSSGYEHDIKYEYSKGEFHERVYNEDDDLYHLKPLDMTRPEKLLKNFYDGNALVNILDVVTFGQFPIGWQHWQLYLVLGTLDQVKNTLDVITQ